ncbi:MAG: KR domain-containing protein, partial [Pirellulales bacterium]|nr:KR domain-containing protein [Pirellulales bacterium]
PPMLLQFDATQRRRHSKRREAASRRAVAVPTAVAAPHHSAPRDDASLAARGQRLVNGLGGGTGNGSGGGNGRRPLEPQPARNGEQAPAALSPSASAPAAGLVAVASPAPSLSASELERMLVGFVVEQTGYPEEIVELDADLEADLGIDSIKKAQLFAEIGERLDVAPRADLSLDDFPTLRHVQRFLLGELAEKTKPMAPFFEADSCQESFADLAPAAMAPPVSHLDVSPPPSLSASELERMLVGFVVEQTGYPEEIVELDADLEADLGIDSIKKAQLFAEIGERLDVAPRADLSLDDFPTLRHVQRFLLAELASSSSLPARPPVDGFEAALLPPPPEQSPAAIIESLDRAAGYDFGRKFSDEIQQVARCFIDHCSSDESSAGPAPQWREFLAGVAEGAGLNPGVVLAMNASSEQLHQAARNCRQPPGRPWPAMAAPILLEIRSGLHPCIISTLPGVFIPPSGSADERLPPAPTELLSQRDAIMRRFVLSAVPSAPVPGAAAYHAGQTATVLGDDPLATAVGHKLHASGLRVRCATLSQLQTAPDLALLLTQTDHLIILPVPIDLQNDPSQSGHAASFLPLLQACQAWLSDKQPSKLPKCSLAAITQMGGDFGFHTPDLRYAGGGVAALLRALRREFSGLRVKAVDVEQSLAAPVVAQLLFDEMQSGDSQLDVGFVGGRRHVMAATASEVSAAAAPLPRGGAWVVSGGARGVTAQVALELAGRTDAQIHLLGASPRPAADSPWRGLDAEGVAAMRTRVMQQAHYAGESPSEAWVRIERAIEIDDTLQRFQAAGVKFAYHQCDIRNRREVAAVLAKVRASAPEGIFGVVHGAGFESASRLARKRRELIERTIAVKCDGAAHLIAETAGDPLQYFVAFGSTSGCFGGLGQADYSLASGLLAKMMVRLGSIRRELRAVCFHWPAWDEVGMAARPESRGVLRGAGLAFMPPAEGCRHFINELLAGVDEREILILDRPQPLDVDGIMSRGIGAEPAQPNPPVATPAMAPSPTSDPFLGPPVRVQDGVYEFAPTVNPQHDPFLNHHRFHGKPIMPGVVIADLFARCARALCGELPRIQLSDVQLLRAVVFDSPDEVQFRLRAAVDGARCRCELWGPDLRPSAQQDASLLYAAGDVEISGSTVQLPRVDPGEPLFGWTPFIYPVGSVVEHGACLQTFKSLNYEHGGGRAQISVERPGAAYAGRQAEDSLIAVEALDGCLVASGFFGYAMLGGRIGIPRRFGRITQIRAPRAHEICTLRFFYRGPSAEGDRFDFTLIGDDGASILAAEAYETSAIRG